MNVLLKRRQLIMATLVIALGAAVFVNWYFTRTSDNVKTGEGESENYVQNLGEARYVNANKNSEQGETAAQDTKADDSFAEIKLNRTKAHDEALDCLKSSFLSLLKLRCRPRILSRRSAHLPISPRFRRCL